MVSAQTHKPEICQTRVWHYGIRHFLFSGEKKLDSLNKKNKIIIIRIINHSSFTKGLWKKWHWSGKLNPWRKSKATRLTPNIMANADLQPAHYRFKHNRVTLYRDGPSPVILALMLDGRQGSPLNQRPSVPLLWTQKGEPTRLSRKATFAHRAASADGHSPAGKAFRPVDKWWRGFVRAPAGAAIVGLARRWLAYKFYLSLK